MLAALRRAPGGELASGKFDSPESSAALVANAFGWFLQQPRKLPPLPGAPPAERLALLVRLGDVRRLHQDDLPGALDAYRQALVLDPGHAPSCKALEAMLEQQNQLQSHHGGADFVMLGGMLAGHDECAGELIERNGKPITTTLDWSGTPGEQQREARQKARAQGG